MIKRVFIVFFFIAFQVNNSEAGTNSVGNIPGYNLKAPKVYFLPDTLREISGLTCLDSNSFACIQDENGILFIYDAIKNKIKHQYTFNVDGDYEGIARVDRSIYVLRSDGVIFEIAGYDLKKFKLFSYPTGIPADNNEGLCYDKQNNRLLVACKGKIGKGPGLKDKRLIYGFDLTTKILTKEPVFDFDLQAIRQFVLEKKVNVPLRQKGQTVEPVIKFNTSAIAIHPFTKKLYLLSAADHLLFIFDMQGKLEHIEKLDKAMFNKAEGITFFENGDMLITNEGQGKKPTLLRFDYTSQ